MSESMAKIRQIKLFYRIMKYRLGVGEVSQGIEFDTQFRTILKKLRQMYTIMAQLRQKADTFDTLAIPLRGGGCRKISLMYQRL